MTEKILVVDDSKLVTDIVKMRLMMYGYEVQLAHSGEEALAKIADDVPDLMVLDVQMPRRPRARRSAYYYAHIQRRQACRF